MALLQISGSYVVRSPQRRERYTALPTISSGLSCSPARGIAAAPAKVVLRVARVLTPGNTFPKSTEIRCRGVGARVLPTARSTGLAAQQSAPGANPLVV